MTDWSWREDDGRNEWLCGDCGGEPHDCSAEGCSETVCIGCVYVCDDCGQDFNPFNLPRSTPYASMEM